MLPAGTVTSPIILDSSISDETVPSNVPIDLECSMCHCLIETPVVSVFVLLPTATSRLNCGHSFCLSHILTLLCNTSAANNATPHCLTCHADILTLPPVNFNLRESINQWLTENKSQFRPANHTDGLRILCLFFHRIWQCSLCHVHIFSDIATHFQFIFQITVKHIQFCIGQYFTTALALVYSALHFSYLSDIG